MLSKSSQENHHPSNLPSALEAHQLKTESDEKIETRQDTGEEKPGGKRIRYQKASFAMRAKLVQMVNNEGFSIRQAAKQLDLKYSTAKCIYKLFVDESRLGPTKISKETLLSARLEDVPKGQTGPENQDSETGHSIEPRSGTKKVKKDNIGEDAIVTKQEYDESAFQSTAKGSFCSTNGSSEKKPLQQRSAVRKTSSNATGSGNVATGGAGKAAPIVITYVPQMYQGMLILVPVKNEGESAENRAPAFDFKALQAENSTKLTCQPFLFNQTVNGCNNLIAGFSFGSNLKVPELNTH